MAKWRVVYRPGWVKNAGGFGPWFVVQPDKQYLAHFASTSLDDAVDVAIRSMELLTRVTIRDRMQ